MFQVIHLESSFSTLHNKSWWQPWVKDSCLQELLLLLNIEHSPNKGGKIPLDYSHYSYAGHWTSRKTLRNTPGCIYLCFSTRKCTPDMFCTPVHTPMMSLPQKWCHLVVGHTLRYIVSKNEVNWTDGSRDIDIFVSYPLLKISPILTIISTWPPSSWDMAESTPTPQ